MKKCHQCHQEIQENMRFCPHCGAEQKKDYKSELNDAMSELFGEEKPKKIHAPVHDADEPASKPKNRIPVIEVDEQPKDHVNKNLSKVLTGVIVILIIALIGVVFTIGSSFFKGNENQQNPEPPVVENPKPEVSKPEINDPEPEKSEELVHESEDVDFTGTFSEGISVSKVEVAKEQGKIKLMVTYTSPGAVEVSLVDDSGKALIGPFDLDKGNSFYLLLNNANQESYTIKIVDKTTSNESKIVVTGKEIQDELD